MLVIYCMHPAKTGATFLLFDIIHNLKNIFNNFLSKYRMDIAVVSFEDILGPVAWVCLVM